jgi:UDP-glucose 4-epimerase
VGEAFIRSYHQEYGLEYTIFRFFNTYGPDQSTDFVVPRFIQAALQNQPITIYGDGSQTRTFCYITDNIEATCKILTEHKYLNDIVNIGNDRETSVLELAREIIRVTESDSEVRHLPPLAEGDMTRRKPDNAKMRAVLQRPLVSLEEGIRNMLVYGNFQSAVLR